MTTRLQRRAVRTFASLRIPAGSVLGFYKDSRITCVVSTSRKVIFRGVELSPSMAAMLVMEEMGYRWPSISGMHYWTYRGIRLSELETLDKPDTAAAAIAGRAERPTS